MRGELVRFLVPRRVKQRRVYLQIFRALSSTYTVRAIEILHERCGEMVTGRTSVDNPFGCSE